MFKSYDNILVLAGTGFSIDSELPRSRRFTSTWGRSRGKTLQTTL